MDSNLEEGEQNGKGNDAKNSDQSKKAISMYARLIGKRNEGSSEHNVPTATVRDRIVNFFATRETAELRQLRAQLKGHKHKLQAELQSVVKANAKHHKRLLDQFFEFRKQEKQLCSWGLKFAVPTFRMQAWVRLSRSALLQDMSSELQLLIDDQLNRTLQYLKQSESVQSRADIQAISNAEGFCEVPEVLMDRDKEMAGKCKRLLRLDVQCNLTTKKFRQYERDFAWKDQQTRKAVLLDILTRYRALPTMEDLPNLEKDMEWDEFCDWFADKSTLQSSLESEFFDFIEDQREKEGRLFFRWCSAVMPSDKSDETATESAFPLSESDQNDAVKEGMFDEVNSNPETAIAAQGLTALKMTPTSIKAFIQYFANDVVGIQYGIPRDLMDVNMSLTEALFYRRVHLFVMRYPNDEMMKKDEHWRLQCQLARFVDPLTYHVPTEYLVNNVTENKKRSKSKDKRSVESNNNIEQSPVKVNLSFESVSETPENELSFTTSRPSESIESLSVASTVINETRTSSISTPGKSRHEKQCNCRNCRTFGLSKRFQQLPTFAAGEYGAAYARSARVMSFLSTVITPKEVIFILSLAYKWLLRDAIDASGSRSTIGADLLVPLFTLVVIGSRIPNIHMIVNFLLSYGSYDEQGDVSYSIANLEGSILFIMDMIIPKDIISKFEATDLFKSMVATRNGYRSGPSPYKSLPVVVAPIAAGEGASKTNIAGPSDAKTTPIKGGKAETAEEDYSAMAQLGEWLRDQQTMEDTITILQKDGWMA